jgi:hypothetical protein
MSSGNKRVITIEAWERTSFRRRSETVTALCSECAAETVMIAPEEFARRCGIAPRLVYRRIEDGDIHFIETQTGALLICSSSLPKTIEIQKGE